MGIELAAVGVLECGCKVMPVAIVPAEITHDNQLPAFEHVLLGTVVVQTEPEFLRRAVPPVVRFCQIEIERTVCRMSADMKRIDGVFRIQVGIGITLQPEGNGSFECVFRVREIITGGEGEFVFSPTVITGGENQSSAEASGCFIIPNDGIVQAGDVASATFIGIGAFIERGIQAGVFTENFGE